MVGIVNNNVWDWFKMKFEAWNGHSKLSKKQLCWVRIPVVVRFYHLDNFFGLIRIQKFQRSIFLIFWHEWLLMVTLKQLFWVRILVCERFFGLFSRIIFFIWNIFHLFHSFLIWQGRIRTWDPLNDECCLLTVATQWCHSYTPIYVTYLFLWWLPFATWHLLQESQRL